MKIFLVPLVLTTILYTLPLTKSSTTIGGIAPEKWNEKCRGQFKDYTDEQAPGAPIHMPGYCERYYCQKYGNGMYGVTTEECKKVTVHRDGCRIKTKKNKEFPFCCPVLECDRRKPRMSGLY